MKSPKIVFVGGGGYAWVPAIVKDLLLKKPLDRAKYVLYDIDLKAAQTLGRYLARLQSDIGTSAEIVTTNNRKRAFRKADYFVIAISTGGLKAMAYDLAIPEKYGIYHTVGDTAGPGGWARLIRNFEVFKKMGEDINALAPRAMVLNYTNPMATLTNVLSRVCKGPVVGLCHGLFANLRFFKTVYGVENEDDISVKYGGLNHFFWITEACIRGRNIIPDLKKRVAGKSFGALEKAAAKDEMGHASGSLIATELFRHTGVMPYLGDRHTCEFLPAYCTNKKVMREFEIKRTTIEARFKALRDRKANVIKMTRKGIPDIYKKSSRETAADIIAAHLQSKPFIDVGNLPNTGQIQNLPLGTVVETSMRVDSNGFSPIGLGHLPISAQAFLEPFCHTYDTVVEACFRKDLKMALDALRMDPICSHLTSTQVREMGSKLIKAHAKFIKAF